MDGGKEGGNFQKTVAHWPKINNLNNLLTNYYINKSKLWHYFQNKDVIFFK